MAVKRFRDRKRVTVGTRHQLQKVGDRRRKRRLELLARRRRLAKFRNREGVVRKVTFLSRKVPAVNRKRRITRSLAILERPRRRLVLV